MRAIIFITILFSISISLHAQNKNEVMVSYVSNGKEIDITKALFYVIENNKAYLLTVKAGYLDISSLIDSDRATLLFIYDNNRVEFDIEPKDIFYLKIEKNCTGFLNLFKCKYEINQGFDYITVVPRAKRDYIFE